MEKITNEIAETFKALIGSDSVRSVIEATQKAADEDTGTFEVVITTENLDRYQEVIKLDGWELEHYLKNPVVLWGHDHSRLIGVCTSLEQRDGKLIAKGKFAPTEEGQEKRKLYEMGFLRATSVGFLEKEREGNLITKAELLEFSFVSVPANPYALSLAVQKELNINELVTKGIFTIKEAEAETTDPVEPEEDASGENGDEEPAASDAETEEETTDTPDLTDEQKALADHIAKLVIAQIKDGALEADEPERTDDEGDEDEDPAVKQFELKKLVQSLDTTLGDLLAEMRQQTPHR
jgi:HK97 family phage prohead protease